MLSHYNRPQAPVPQTSVSPCRSRYAQAHMAAAHHLHEVSVHALRKAHMPLHQTGTATGAVSRLLSCTACGFAHGYHRYQNSSWLRWYIKR